MTSKAIRIFLVTSIFIFTLEFEIDIGLEKKFEIFHKLITVGLTFVPDYRVMAQMNSVYLCFSNCINNCTDSFVIGNERLLPVGQQKSAN